MRSAIQYLLVFLPLFAVAVASDGIQAQSWTQWGGPKRDFQVNGSELPNEIKFAESWRRSLGAGYSAILVQDGKLFTMYRVKDDEFVVCLNEADGKTIWEHSYSAPMGKDAATEFGKGPNSTPIITGDLIISIGFNGDVHCLKKSSGSVVWRTNVVRDLAGTQVDLGYSPSPILYDKKLILGIGGQGKGVAALNVEDGSVAWSALDFNNSYSTPVLTSVDGLDQMIFVMTDDVVSINPKNGKPFWTFPLKNQWSTHAFVPIWDPASKTLFVSSFRQSHALQLKREGDQITFEKKWSIPNSGIGFTNAVLVNGIVIGCTGGSRSSMVTGINLKDGKILWRERGFPNSNFLSLGDRILLLDENGQLAVARPSTQTLNITQKQKVLSAPKAWTVPTLVGHRLFLRDQKEIVRYTLDSP